MPDADDNSCSMLVEISFIVGGVWAQNVLQGKCQAIFNNIGQPCVEEGSFGVISLQTDNEPVLGTVEADFSANSDETCATPSPTCTSAASSRG